MLDRQDKGSVRTKLTTSIVYISSGIKTSARRIEWISEGVIYRMNLPK